MTARRFEDAPAVPRLCECGCGRITPISRSSHPKRGYRKGEHARYIPGHGRRKASASERLAAKLAPPHPSTGCIEFTGYRDPRGYGQIGIGSRDDVDMAAKGRGLKSRRGLPFGVSKNGSGWLAQVTFRRKNYYCGTFRTVEEAASAAARKKEELRGSPVSSS